MRVPAHTYGPAFVFHYAFTFTVPFIHTRTLTYALERAAERRKKSQP